MVQGVDDAAVRRAVRRVVDQVDDLSSLTPRLVRERAGKIVGANLDKHKPLVKQCIADVLAERDREEQAAARSDNDGSDSGSPAPPKKRKRESQSSASEGDSDSSVEGGKPSPAKKPHTTPQRKARAGDKKAGTKKGTGAPKKAAPKKSTAGEAASGEVGEIERLKSLIVSVGIRRSKIGLRYPSLKTPEELRERLVSMLVKYDVDPHKKYSQKALKALRETIELRMESEELAKEAPKEASDSAGEDDSASGSENESGSEQEDRPRPATPGAKRVVLADDSESE